MKENIKPVKSIWFNGENGDEVVSSRGELKLTYFSIYMGDRRDEWVSLEKNGVEIIRYNVRYIATIEWDLTPKSN